MTIKIETIPRHEENEDARIECPDQLDLCQ